MKLSRDIGIDLGTANVLVYEEGRGIVLREPSVVAVDKNTGKVLQVGAAARNMLGRTPGNIVAVRPLRDGVISDYEMTEKMLEQFLKKIIHFALIKPRVIVSVPSGVTEVEERAVIQATMEAGARRVYLIEEPFAAALGAKLNISGPDGHMIVDIGGGTTDIAVLSLNPHAGDGGLIGQEEEQIIEDEPATGEEAAEEEIEEEPIKLRGETKICPVCKAEVDGDALFCNHCGAQL